MYDLQQKKDNPPLSHVDYPPFFFPTPILIPMNEKITQFWFQFFSPRRRNTFPLFPFLSWHYSTWPPFHFATQLVMTRNYFLIWFFLYLWLRFSIFFISCFPMPPSRQVLGICIANPLQIQTPMGQSFSPHIATIPGRQLSYFHHSAGRSRKFSAGGKEKAVSK